MSRERSDERVCMSQPVCKCGPAGTEYECNCVRAKGDRRNRGAQCGGCFAVLVTVDTYEKKLNDSGERTTRRKMGASK